MVFEHIFKIGKSETVDLTGVEITGEFDRAIFMQLQCTACDFLIVVHFDQRKEKFLICEMLHKVFTEIVFEDLRRRRVVDRIDAVAFGMRDQ